MSKHIWVVGQVFPKDQSSDVWEFFKPWEIQGIFDSESGALECIGGYSGDFFFIGKAVLNKPMPLDTCDWVESWYPKLDDRPENEKAE